MRRGLTGARVDRSARTRRDEEAFFHHFKSKEDWAAFGMGSRTKIFFVQTKQGKTSNQKKGE
jgi:hypothetical protein